ncbi:MAG: hypothetical protein JNM56_29940 [Planctomycetia bacterium]|nr:hypothetical protein [Planctomycetia bacterium]
MIAFACNQCGQRFDRPDSAAGSVLFCSCGARNVVPWESTLTGPPPEPASVPARPAWQWSPPAPASRQRDSAFCFNHQETPQQHTCADCGEKFCADCVLTLHGQTVCGPCKNFRVRARQRPPRVSVMAIFSPLLAMISAPPLGFTLFVVAGVSAQADASSTAGMLGAVAVVGLLAIGVQLFALLLGGLSLRAVETNSHISGRSLAITGVVASVVCAILLGEVAVLVLRLLD